MARFLFVVTLTLFTASSRLSFAQMDNPNQGTHLPPLVQSGQGMSSPPMKSGDDASQQLLQNYRKQRQLELVRDAEKLHQLSGELKEFLDKNGTAVLSLDMLKKAEAAEKLAHSVRTKMKELQ